MATLKQLPDSTGCQHRLDGPTRNDGVFEYGYCSACKNQVALQLDGSGRRTGESFIVVIEP
jgi:hypothetical protein